MADAAKKSNVYEFPSKELPNIPAGEYELAFDYFEVRPIHRNTPKLVMWFKVVGPEHMGFPIPAYYRVKLKGKAGRSAPFSVGKRSEFLRQYVQLFHEEPRRLDRVPMTKFNNQVIVARVSLVKKNLLQRDIPKLLQYNVVDELLRVATKRGIAG